MLFLSSSRLDTVTGKKTLRSRYLHIAFLITFVLLSCALSLQLYVSFKSQQSARALEKQSNRLHQITVLQLALANGDTLIDSHLLKPSAKSIGKWNRQFALISASLAALKNAHWNSDTARQIQLLEQDLLALNRHTLRLIALPLSISRQYPGIFHAHTRMLPAHQQFLSAVNKALAELESESHHTANDLFHRNLSLARSYWLQAVGHFRMYLVIRLSSMAPSLSSRTQLANSEAYQEAVDGLIKKMLLESGLEKNARYLGLDLRSSLRQMAAAAARWSRYYQQVKKLNSDRYWRRDQIIRANKLQPLKMRIDRRLQHLVTVIDKLSKTSLASVSQTANEIIVTLWVLTALGLVVIIIAYRYFDSRVLQPVAQITQALNAEAVGKHTDRLPVASFSETQSLVNAFSFMRNQIRVRESMLEHQALHDTLTQLPNRALLENSIERLIRQADTSTRLAVLVLDLNEFKEVNDSLGHHTGDLVLEQAAARIKNLLSADDIVARLGGDEFAVLLPHADRNEAVLTAEKIARAIANAYIVDNHSLHIGASIGIALFPQHAHDTSSLLKAADVAMYIAKRRHQACYVYHSHSTNRHSAEQNSMAADLRTAIAAGRLQLLYQPIIALHTNTIAGAEVLLGWQPQQQGHIAPEDITTMAEHQGCAQELIQWVLTNALRSIAKQRSTLGADFYLSIDVSTVNLKQPDFSTLVRNALQEAGIDAARLMLEIPESALVSANRRIAEHLDALHALGVRLSVDHFGTGLSSIVLLKRTPLSCLKLDSELTDGIHTDEEKAVIVHSMIDLAHNIGLQVTAAGIDDLQTLQRVETMGTDNAQGDYLCRPTMLTGLPLQSGVYHPCEEQAES